MIVMINQRHYWLAHCQRRSLSDDDDDDWDDRDAVDSRMLSNCKWMMPVTDFDDFDDYDEAGSLNYYYYL
jgi:hypothetical protein